jgi:hypothetical protein
MKKKFIQFLKDNNALIPLCNNLALGSNRSLSQHLNQTTNPEDYLCGNDTKRSAGFWWEDTTEGDDYWYDLNAKWEATLK